MDPKMTTKPTWTKRIKAASKVGPFPVDKIEEYRIHPDEPPVCCEEVPPQLDRFDPKWNNGNTRVCKKCNAEWCKC